MIVEPDFLDHWRTQMLVGKLGKDERAPLYLLRIWGHCQVRKGTRFSMPAEGLKALCRADTEDADVFERALADCGFIRREGEFVEVLKWADANSKLVAAWRNGSSGGRPPKGSRATEFQDDESGTEEEPTQNPTETEDEPNENRTTTHEKPIGEDKSREEEIPTPSGVGAAQPPAERNPADHCPHEAIIAAYHECLPTGRRIRDWTPARASALRARWREDAKRQNLAWWRRFFLYCADSKFLTGRVHREGRKPFELSLDWLVKAENFAKVREGAYHEAADESGDGA